MESRRIKEFLHEIQLRILELERELDELEHPHATGRSRLPNRRRR